MDRINASSNARLRRSQLSRSSSLSQLASNSAPESKDTKLYYFHKFLTPQAWFPPNLDHPNIRPRGNRFRLILKWFGMLYLGFCVLVFRPIELLNTLVSWSQFGTAIPGLLPMFYNTPLGTMDTPLLFSKLAPRLGALVPDALQLVSSAHGSQVDTNSSVTCCVWIPDSHLETLEGWIGIPGCSSSLLVSTNHFPETPAHRQLIRSIQQTVKRSMTPKDIIVVISTRARPSNPNTYINLARLFSQTPWTLLVPPGQHPVLPTREFSDWLLHTALRIQTVDSRLAFTFSRNHSYSDGLLLPRNSSIWCSEHDFFERAGHEWLDCTGRFLSHYNETNDTQE